MNHDNYEIRVSSGHITVCEPGSPCVVWCGRLKPGSTAGVVPCDHPPPPGLRERLTKLYGPIETPKRYYAIVTVRMVVEVSRPQPDADELYEAIYDTLGADLPDDAEWSLSHTEEVE